MPTDPTSAPPPAPVPRTPTANEKHAAGQIPTAEEHPGEITLAVIREHWRALVFPLIAAAVLAVGMVWLFSTVKGNFFGRAAFFLILQIAVPAWIWRAGRPIVRWFRTSYVLTTRRVLIRQGFPDFDEDPIELLQCASLRLHMSPVDRAFGSGTIQLVPGKYMVRVPRAKKLQKDITELHDSHAAGAAELYDLLLRLGYNVGPRV